MQNLNAEEFMQVVAPSGSVVIWWPSLLYSDSVDWPPPSLGCPLKTLCSALTPFLSPFQPGADYWLFSEKKDE